MTACCDAGVISYIKTFFFQVVYLPSILIVTFLDFPVGIQLTRMIFYRFCVLKSIEKERNNTVLKLDGIFDRPLCLILIPTLKKGLKI
jgi:hypothetical protein